MSGLPVMQQLPGSPHCTAQPAAAARGSSSAGGWLTQGGSNPTGARQTQAGSLAGQVGMQDIPARVDRRAIEPRVHVTVRSGQVGCCPLRSIAHALATTAAPRCTLGPARGCRALRRRHDMALAAGALGDGRALRLQVAGRWAGGQA
jgi:hypothetical protein